MQTRYPCNLTLAVSPSFQQHKSPAIFMQSNPGARGGPVISPPKTFSFSQIKLMSPQPTQMRNFGGGGILQDPLGNQSSLGYKAVSLVETKWIFDTSHSLHIIITHSFHIINKFIMYVIHHPDLGNMIIATYNLASIILCMQGQERNIEVVFSCTPLATLSRRSRQRSQNTMLGDVFSLSKFSQPERTLHLALEC